MNSSGHVMIKLLVCLATLHGTYGGTVIWSTPSGGNTGATHTASISESAVPGDAVTSVTAATDGGSIASYAIGTQVPAGSKFTIATATSGAVTVAAGESFDHETQGSYDVEVVATDNDGTPGSSTIVITVTITDDIETDPAYASATQTNQQICSTATSGTIGTYTITGHASRLTWNAIAYAIRSGDDVGSAKFAINSGTGVLTKTSQAFDVATKSQYVLIIDGVSAGAAVATASTTLTVTAVASACSSSASVISGSLVAMATVLLSSIINRLL